MAGRKPKAKTAQEKLTEAAKIVSLFETNPADDDEDEEDARLRDDVLEDLEKLDDEHGDGISWELYCDVPLDKKGQIRKIARSELRNLRDECLGLGPGEYHVIARMPDGLFVKGSRKNIRISGLARGPTPPAPVQQFDPHAFMAQVEEREARRADERKRERWAMIKFWAPIAAPIAAEVAKGLFGSRSGDNLKDMVGALVGMKDLLGGGSGGDKQVETLLKGMELQRDLAPADAKGSTWPDVIVNGVTGLAKEFRPLIDTIAQRKQQGTPAGGSTQLQFAPTPQPTAAGAAAIGAPAAPAGSSPPASTPTEDDEMIRMFEPLLRKLASDLEDFAVNAADPELTADALLAKIPRLVRSQLNADQVKGWLTDPQWWSVLVKFHPALTPYQGFCDEVREEIIAAVTEPANPDNTEGTDSDVS